MSRPRLSVTTRVSSSFSVATYVTLSQKKYFFEALFLSQQAFPCCHNQCRDRRGFCCDRDFALYSSTLLQHKLSLSQLTGYILPIFCHVSSVFCHDKAHLSILRPLCCGKEIIVVTEFLCHLLGSLLQHTKLCRDRDYFNCSFSLLSYCSFLLFELKPAKHKVSKYSIIWD